METGGCRELRRRAAWPALLAVLVLAGPVLAGCGSKQNALDPQGEPARHITSLWWILLTGCSLAFAILAAFLLAAYVRRHRAGAPGGRDPERVGWIVVLSLGLVVPIAALSAIFLFGNIVVLRETAPPPASAAPGHPALKVRVIAHQFWWEFRYPGTGAVTANELHIPAGTPVELLVHTDDVIHSFWVPQLNRKIDAIPEQVNRLLIQADRPGRYRGQCAEFCGLQHARMGMYVYADPPARFRRWLAHEARPAPRSNPTFVSKCGACHTVRGGAATGNAGPDLTHVASRASLAALTIPNSPERLRQWIRHPQEVKPGNAMPAVDLTRAQLVRILAYLETLR